MWFRQTENKQLITSYFAYSTFLFTRGWHEMSYAERIEQNKDQMIEN